MFRKMRRSKQLLSHDEVIAILKTHTSGVLAVSGDDDYPYTVPLSYFYRDGKMFFHCAKEGHKLDGIKKNDKVSFCVIDRDNVVQETYTTHFQSVIVFGRARIITSDTEKMKALEDLVMKYSPDYVDVAKKEIESSWNNVCLVEVQIEHMTGKAAIEIVKGK